MEVTEKTGLDAGKSYINGFTMRYKVVGLYIFLLAGGLWHLLDLLQPLMQLMAAPVMIALPLWMIWEYSQSLNNQHHKSRTARKQDLNRFLAWCLAIIGTGFALEWIGVQSGLLFGDYTYGSTLQPQLLGVPIAIGFSWLGMLLASTAVVFRLVPGLVRQKPYWAALFPAVMMVIFDVFMEPAAVKLGYWHWAGDIIPFYNYVCWFGIAYVFALSAWYLKTFSSKFPGVIFHAYFAQLGYFALVFLGSLRAS